MLDERGLHRMQGPSTFLAAFCIAIGKPFKGCDVLAGNGRQRRHAGTNRFTIYLHSTRAALRQAAAKTRAVLIEIVSQHVKQRRIRRHIYAYFFAVDGQPGRFGHVCSLVARLNCWQVVASTLVYVNEMEWRSSGRNSRLFH